MTRMLATGLVTLVGLLALTWWLRPALESRRDAGAPAREGELEETARDAAEAGLDLIVEYLPPAPTPERERTIEGPLAPAPAAAAPTPSPPAPARPASRPTREPEPVAALEEERVPDRAGMPFVESGAPAEPAGEVAAAATTDGDQGGDLPPVAAGPADPDERASLIRRLLSVYDRLGDAP